MLASSPILGVVYKNQVLAIEVFIHCLTHLGLQSCDLIGLLNRPFPSSSQPPFQSEAKCEVFVMKINFLFILKLELIIITKI